MAASPHAHESVSLSEDRLRLIVDAAPSGILMVNRSGIIVLVNSQIERLFQYDRDELINQPIELLVPEVSREKHPAYRNEFFNEPTARAMGVGRDLFGLRKDGRQIPVEIGLNPLISDGETFVLASVVDITERKRSEERLRLVVEAAPSGMIMVEENGNIVMVNYQVERMFGYSREELIGQSVDLLVPADLRETHPQHRFSFFEDPKARAMGIGRDLYGQHKDGTQIPVEIGLNPLFAEGERFVLASVVDITERKRYEERIRLVVEAAPSGMIMVNETGRIVLVNSQVERLFGYSRDESIGQYIEFLVPAASRGKHPGLRDRFFSDPKARAMGVVRDLYGQRKDGSQIPVEIGLNPIMTEGETFVLASILDITKRKRSEALLQQKMIELQRSNEDLQQFDYVCSHD
ncbi:MAG: PAS domain S-box protein [Cyanobacteria bacterium]|nr:PAS domain S-box protein [Cyanobacteriota bacterium]